MKLMLIWGSSRNGRKGGVVAEWVNKFANTDNRFEVDFVDLKELDLPFLNEPISPFSMKDAGVTYTVPRGKIWAERVGSADAFIIITPEYNRGYPGVLKNALDWVGPEWVDKPVAFVAYGGVSAGSYAVSQLRAVTVELGLVQVSNPIHFQYFEKSFGSGEQPNEKSNASLAKMLDELVRLYNKFKK